MRTIPTPRLAALLVAVLALALALGACGGSDDGDGITVADGWARTTAPSQEMGAAYMEITGGDEADRLIAVRVPTDVAAEAQIHETVMAEDTMDMGEGTMSTGEESMDMGEESMGSGMTMREVDGIDIPAGETVALKPGGFHVMLMGLAKPLATGDAFDATLVFEKGGEVVVPITVRES